MLDRESVNKLNNYPELCDRIKQLLAIMENENGETTLANEAERRVIEEMRAMGQKALQGWAEHQAASSVEKAPAQKTGLRKHEKKSLFGTQPTEPLR